MNIKTGYKQTEIGVIPEDWEVIEFGNIVNYIKGFPFRSKDYVSDGIRIIRVSDTSYDSIKQENGIFISENRANEFRNWKLDEYDLIFSTVGSKPPMYDSMVGKVILVKEEFAGSLLNQNAVLIRAKQKTKFIQELLLNNFRTKRYLKHIEEIFRGNANQASITLEELFKYKIPLPALPALPEQTAIVAALSDVDALMGELDKLIAKKRNIKQATMQQLLTGKKRLAGFSGEWEVKKFKDVTDLITCGIAATPKYVNESNGVPFLSSTNVKNGQISWSNFKFISKELHNQLYKNNPPLKGDILYSRVGTIGEAAIVDVDFEFSIYVSLTLIKTSLLNNEFLKQLLNSNTYKKLANNTVLMGGGVGNLNVNVVREFPISFPSIEEQTAIATILSDIDAEINALQQKRDKTAQLKAGMMQELLTGRICLNPQESMPC